MGQLPGLPPEETRPVDNPRRPPQTEPPLLPPVNPGAPTAFVEPRTDLEVTQPNLAYHAAPIEEADKTAHLTETLRLPRGFDLYSERLPAEAERRAAEQYAAPVARQTVPHREAPGVSPETVPVPSRPPRGAPAQDIPAARLSAPPQTGARAPEREAANQAVNMTVFNVFQQETHHPQLLFKPEHALLLLLLVGIFLVRATNLAYNTLHLDEAIYLTVGEDVLSGVYDQGATQWMFGSYLYPIVSRVLALVGGVTAVRLFSALLLTAAALIVYHATRRIFDDHAALWAAFIFGLTGISINLGQFAVYDALAVPLLAGAVYFAIVAMQTPERQSRSLIWSGLLFSLAVLTKYMAILALPALIAVMFLVHLSQGRGLLNFVTRVPWLAFLAPMLIILGIYGAYYLDDLRVVLTGQYAEQPESRFQVLGQIIRDLGLVLLFALLAVPLLAQQMYDRSAQRPELLVLFGMVLPFFLVFISAFPLYHLLTANARSMWKHEVYTLIFLAPLAGYTIARLISFLRRQGALPIRAAGALVMIVGMLLFLVGSLRQNTDFHQSWLNTASVTEYMRSIGVSKQQRILTPSYAIYEYYFDFGVDDRQTWNNIWHTEFNNQRGVDAVRAAVRACAFDLLVLDSYYAPELAGELEYLARDAGYQELHRVEDSISTSSIPLRTTIYSRGTPQCQQGNQAGS